MNSHNYWDSAKYKTTRTKELNTINKITIKVTGYKTITFKKPSKGWKFNYDRAYIDYFTLNTIKI
ncbi:MAG: hypothetical protein LBU74_03315 [Methanobacteriaceae archaeon]|jgi:hypothetical protein|nr:hypothetical protein [Candidatus Methanorudis spinitermitis]